MATKQQTEQPQVGTFEVDLKGGHSPLNHSSSQNDSQQQSKLPSNNKHQNNQIQLSQTREQIESKPNELLLDDEEVALIREILFSKINLADFDKQETERFRNDAHSIRRYVRLGQDRTSTLYRTAACVKACLEWRKSLELYNLKDDDFSDEVRVGHNIIYIQGKTVNNENILWIRAGLHRSQYNTEESRKWLSYQLDCIDRVSNECGFIVCIDCTGAGTSCVDLNFVSYFIKVIMFFRGNLRYVLVHDMGWLLGATWRIIKSWLPKEQQDAVKMAGKKELGQYVAPNQLPDYARSQENN